MEKLNMISPFVVDLESSQSPKTFLFTHVGKVYYNIVRHVRNYIKTSSKMAFHTDITWNQYQCQLTPFQHGFPRIMWKLHDSNVSTSNLLQRKEKSLPL